MQPDVVVVGAGLAGCEAALQLSRRGFKVRLYEQKPKARSEAAHSDQFAELVCSNSFRARNPINAVGQLKREMTSLGSFFMAAAYHAEVPAGGAMAVDRERFSEFLGTRIQNDPNIDVVTETVDTIPFDAQEVIVATGPLTGGGLAEDLARLAGSENLHFYDAIAPIIDAESINLDVAFFASRYDKGGDDYLNLPLDKEGYYRFVEELKTAEKVLPREFEDPKYFEGCLPVDILAERGPDTLAFGPMKPVGLIDPRTEKRPYAVIQLRKENKAGTAYNMVGFQTRLKHGEQTRIFRSIPGLEKAEFLRLGSVHRNTFISSPGHVDRHLRLRRDPRVSLAGQISGVEGYVESAASGLFVGLMTASRLSGQPIWPCPLESTLGALMGYLITPRDTFEPSNVILAMLPPLTDGKRRGKRQRKEAYSQRAQIAIERWIEETKIQLLDPS